VSHRVKPRRHQPPGDLHAETLVTFLPATGSPSMTLVVQATSRSGKIFGGARSAFSAFPRIR